MLYMKNRILIFSKIVTKKVFLVIKFSWKAVSSGYIGFIIYTC